MLAVEFEATSKNGVIHIPQEYKDVLWDRDDIRLVVMYDFHKQKVQNKVDNELETIEKLFSASDNKIKATKELVVNTNGMSDDIS